MKKVLLFMIGILCALQVSAQNTDAMLFGDVKSKETGKHLPYATVKVKGSKRQTMCDGTGHFKLVNLPVGKLTVVATMVGYKDQELVVTMQRGKGTEAYFELDDDQLSLNQVVVTGTRTQRSEEHTSELQSRQYLVCRLLLEKKKKTNLYLTSSRTILITV